MRKLTLPRVCHARTVPIACPLALMSGIGGPPAGSRAVSHPTSGATVAAAKAAVTNSIGRMGFGLLRLFNPLGLTWFRLDLDQHLTFGDLSPRRGRELGDRPVERSGQRMLHLHRFKREQALPFGNLFAA